MNGFIEAQVRRSARVNLRNAIILFIAVLVIALVTAQPMTDVLRGAQNFDRSALLAGTPQAGFVRVPMDSPLINTGVLQSRVVRSRNSSRTITEYFRALPVGDRYLIIQTEDTNLTDALTGELIAADSEDDRGTVIPAMERAAPVLKGKLLPYKLYVTNAPPFGWFALAIVLALAAFGVLQLWRFAQRASDPRKHPLMRSLARYGDPLQLAAAIDAEIDPATTRLPVWTSRWLITQEDAMPFAEVAWAHPHTVKSRGSVAYYGRLYDRAGHMLTLPLGGKGAAVDAFMEAVLQRAPWATLGYTAELAELWRDGRAEFLAEVELRRRQVN